MEHPPFGLVEHFPQPFTDQLTANCETGCRIFRQFELLPLR